MVDVVLAFFSALRIAAGHVVAASLPMTKRVNQPLSAAAYAYTPPGTSTTTDTPNTLNQYATVAAVTQSYDNNGNLTGDSTWMYTFDAENRLLTANKTGVLASYLDDPFGRREQKTVGAAITKYGYDGTSIIEEYDNAGTRTLDFRR